MAMAIWCVMVIAVWGAVGAEDRATCVGGCDPCVVVYELDVFREKMPGDAVFLVHRSALFIGE